MIVDGFVLARFVNERDWTDPAMVEYFHGQGIAVRAWGVGHDESLAGRLISLGVDGMTFDDPRRLAELLTTAAPTNRDTA